MEKHTGYLRQEKRPELCVYMSSFSHILLLVYGQLLVLKTRHLAVEINSFALVQYIQRD